MSIIVLNKQSLLDIAMQEYGNAQAAFDLAMANNLSLTDVLKPGRELRLPESAYLDADILNYYKRKQIHPATAISTIAEPEGISYWAVSVDFRVSQSE